MFKRIKSGWQLTKKSWRILSDEPGLIKFPLVGGLLALLVAIVLIGPGLYFVDQGPEALGIVLAAIGIYLAAFVNFYFAVGLAHNADQRMHGNEATFGEGMALASSRMSQIAGWAFVSTVVMTIVRWLQERFGIAGAILGGLVGAAWGILSFLAVPVIALEGTGPIATLKRCGTLVKSRWGEQITGTIAIGGAVFLFGILPAMLFIVAGVVIWTTSAAGGVILIGLGVMVFIVAALIQQALSTIFGVALYRYVAGQEVVGGFTTEEMESAVRTKGKLGGGPGMPSTSASTI
ncbi:MAG TPA: DUF6159 family protein [Solirubrobacterales bacterium]|nr:DUF6159 family protein [Solirubrobacterales bacterium]